MRRLLWMNIFGTLVKCPKIGLATFSKIIVQQLFAKLINAESENFKTSA